MFNMRPLLDGRSPAVSISRLLCIWATWVSVVTSLPPAAVDVNAATGTSTTGRFALIPSAPRLTSLIPSAALKSFPPGLIPSAPRTSSIVPSEQAATGGPSSTSETTVSAPAHTFLIPSKPAVSFNSQPPPSNSPLVPYPSGVGTLLPSNGTPITGTANATSSLVMPTKASTDEPLRPVPGPTTNPGDPNGHHEISEPNFTNSSPCRHCSPVVEVTATGWDDTWTHPVAEPQESTERPPAATIPAGPSNIVVTQAPAGTDFVVGSTTVKVGQTVVVDNTPIVIQTSAGHAQVIVGNTQTVSLGPAQAVTAAPHRITSPPLVFLPITVGSQTFTPVARPALDGNGNSNPSTDPNDKSNTNPSTGPDGTSNPSAAPEGNSNTNPSSGLDGTPNPSAPLNPSAAPDGNSNSNPSPAIPVPAAYIASGQTLLPGGPALTLSGTTYSLFPAATVLEINGQSTTLTPTQAAIYTTTSAAALTVFGKTITANRAGYYVIAPGTTLIPGGAALTYSGTVLSLAPEGTAAVIQGSTSMLVPATTVVTLTRSGDVAASGGGGGEGEATGASGTTKALPYPSGNSAALGVDAERLGGIYALFVLVVGWAAVWL